VIVSDDNDHAIGGDKHIIPVFDLNPLTVRQAEHQRKPVLCEGIFDCFGGHEMESNCETWGVQPRLVSRAEQRGGLRTDSLQDSPEVMKYAG
jgi:hypothetical protein